MYSQSLIQVKIDRPLKDEVAEIFAALGFDLSTAIRMFLQRCKTVKGIPFELTLATGKPKVQFGLAKDEWSLPDDWYRRDRAFDKQLERDFYADPA